MVHWKVHNLLDIHQHTFTLERADSKTRNRVKMTMREQEVGVFDFVLLDEITLEKFMQNLRKRYVCVCDCLRHTGVVKCKIYTNM